MSRQDEVNPAFLLATQVGKMDLGLPAFFSQEILISVFGHIINLISTMLVWSRWLDIDLAFGRQ